MVLCTPSFYDGLGVNTYDDDFLQPMKEAGIEKFVEFDPIFQLLLVTWTVNYEPSKKLIIVDGKNWFYRRTQLSVMNIWPVPRNFLFGW